MLSLEVSDFLGEPSHQVHRTHGLLVLGDDAVLEAHPEVVLTEVRGLVDDARARLGRHITVTQHSEGALGFVLKKMIISSATW